MTVKVGAMTLKARIMDEDKSDPQFNATTARLLRREALRRAAEELNTTSPPGLERMLDRISAEVTAEAAAKRSAPKPEPDREPLVR
jgi:hypothetical protein